MRRREQSGKGGVYIALFIAFIMISSVIGYLYTGDANGDPNLSYNGFSFTSTQQGWVTTINGQQRTFTYHPTEATAISLPLATISLLTQGQVYVSYNPNSTEVETLALAQFALIKALQEQNIPALPATTQPTAFNTTVITCESGKRALILEEASETKITAQNTCILAVGNPILIKDRILYGLYGVMQ